MNGFLNEIICGDCIEVLSKFSSSCIDLVVTSPPYNLRNSSGNGLKDGRGGKWKNAKILNGYEGYKDNLSYDEYVLWQRNCLREMLRVLKDDGAIFYNHKWRVQKGLLQDRNEILKGFPLRQIIIWNRCGGINFNRSYFLPTYEVIYLIAKKNFRLKKKANAIGDVWKFSQERNNVHPAPFPVELPYRCIKSTDAKVILDPFMGSGTTALACRKLERYYIGIEISQEYCDLAEERLRND